MVVRPVQVHQLVTECFQTRERGWRTIDELPVRTGGCKTAFNNQITIAWFDTCVSEARVQVRAIIAAENRFHGARFRAGADEPFVPALAKQKLKRANDDRFSGA